MFFYVIRLGGDFMEWRFVDPITGVLFAGIGVGLFVIGQESVRWVFSRYDSSMTAGKGRAVVSTAAAGIACAVIGLSLLYRAAEAGNRPRRPDVIIGQETIDSLKKYALAEYAWKDIGRTCKRTFPGRHHDRDHRGRNDSILRRASDP